MDFELNGKCKDLVVMGWAGGFIIIDLKNDIILCFMKTKRTAAFTHLEERWKLEDSSYQKNQGDWRKGGFPYSCAIQ